MNPVNEELTKLGPLGAFLVVFTGMLTWTAVEVAVEGEPISVMEALSESSDCYVTGHGVVVRHVGEAKCPPRWKVERMTSRGIKRMGWIPEHVEGITVVLSDRFPEREGIDNWSTQDGSVSVVKGGWGWDASFRHALGHAYLGSIGPHDDPLHRLCGYWWRYDRTRCVELEIREPAGGGLIWR